MKEKKYFCNSDINLIIIAGAGATGSYLTAFLTKNLKILNKKIPVVIVDFDIVEEKNLRNQNFTIKDLNKNKAKVLAEKYTKVYPYIYHAVDRIENYLLKIRTRNNQSIIIAICVDNFNTRYKIFELVPSFFTLIKSSNIIIVDSGVHENGGQVLIFPFTRHSTKKENAPKQLFTGFDYYDNIPWHLKLAKPGNKQISCGNGILPIWNIIAASLATQYIIKIVSKHSLDHLGIFFGDKIQTYSVNEFESIMKLFEKK